MEREAKFKLGELVAFCYNERSAFGRIVEIRPDVVSRSYLYIVRTKILRVGDQVKEVELLERSLLKVPEHRRRQWDHEVL